MAGHDGPDPAAVVVAPQASATPNEDTWNWRDHVQKLGEVVRNRYRGRRLVATGFSRGGLGVLQVLAAFPDLFDRWAIVDPQPPNNQQEAAAILAAASTRPGWLRYGVYRNRSAAWSQFANALESVIPEQHRDVMSHSHGDMALYAYSGDRLSSAPKQSLYERLDIRF